ncbi:MAG: tol-pal system protein YbgF [Magnetococcales bacterium]|nr:tol-pal system protein YbgF [Magnetococcales bacterium]
MGWNQNFLDRAVFVTLMRLGKVKGWVPALVLFFFPLYACVSSGPSGDAGPDYYGDSRRPPVRTEAGPPAAPPKPPLPEVVDSLSNRVEKYEDLQRNVATSMEKRLGLMEKEITSLRGEVEHLQHAKTRLEAELEAKNKLAMQQAQQAAQQGAPGLDANDPDDDPADQGAVDGNGDTVEVDEEAPATVPPGGVTGVSQGAAARATAPTAKGAAKAGVVTSTEKKAAPSRPKPENSKQAYEEAFLLLKGGRYDESLAVFKNFMEWFPNDPLADNAQYWIGELYYVQRKFPDALMAFNQVLVRWPNSGKVPASLLKIGFAFFELGDMENARNSLTRLISDFPESPAVSMAKQRLEMIEEKGGKR